MRNVALLELFIELCHALHQLIPLISSQVAALGTWSQLAILQQITQRAAQQEVQHDTGITLQGTDTVLGLATTGMQLSDAVSSDTVAPSHTTGSWLGI